MVDYDRLSEDRLWVKEVNQAKLDWKHEQPKVYREGGGRWSKSQNKVVKMEKHIAAYIEDLEGELNIPPPDPMIDAND